MYHPTRGGVRGGRDQFSWDDVKADKHRENYIGHSLKAPVGRWQKGKDLHWYARDKNGSSSDADAMKEEIQRIKEQEEQAMREALGLAPKRAPRPQGNRLDKHEFKELIKRGSTAEDLGAGHAEAARVHDLGHTRLPRPWEEPPTSVEPGEKEASPEVAAVAAPEAPGRKSKSDESEDERESKKRRREERKRDRHEKREKRHSRDSEDKKQRKHKEKRRHDSD